MTRKPAGVPAFRSGESLFVLEENVVRILGDSGTEAVVPVEDLKALLEHLEATEAPPFPSAPASESASPASAASALAPEDDEPGIAEAEPPE
jgi:hypothetical protein